jgi:hypothetical protein
MVLRLNAFVPLYPVVPLVLHKTAPPQAVALSAIPIMLGSGGAGTIGISVCAETEETSRKAAEKISVLRAKYRDAEKNLFVLIFFAFIFMKGHESFP